MKILSNVALLGALLLVVASLEIALAPFRLLDSVLPPRGDL